MLAAMGASSYSEIKDSIRHFWANPSTGECAILPEPRIQRRGNSTRGCHSGISKS
jgi:hypothetical protein